MPVNLTVGALSGTLSKTYPSVYIPLGLLSTPYREVLPTLGHLIATTALLATSARSLKPSAVLSHSMLAVTSSMLTEMTNSILTGK